MLSLPILCFSDVLVFLHHLLVLVAHHDRPQRLRSTENAREVVAVGEDALDRFGKPIATEPSSGPTSIRTNILAWSGRAAVSSGCAVQRTEAGRLTRVHIEQLRIPCSQIFRGVFRTLLSETLFVSVSAMRPSQAYRLLTSTMTTAQC